MARSDDPSPARAAQALADGIALHRAGRVAEAAERYLECTALDPANADAYSNLGVAQRSLGRLDDAVTSYKRALALAPGSAATYSNLGIALQDLGRIDEAIASLRHALEIKPDYAEAYSNLGSCIARLRRFAEAIPCFERAIALRPDLAELHHNLASACVALRRVDRAIIAFRKVLELEPRSASAHTWLGLCLLYGGQAGEALAHCTKAIELAPQSPDAHRNLGVAQRVAGRLPESIASLRKAAVLKPDFADAHNDLATSLHALGDLEGAAEATRRAVAVNPAFAGAWCNLGVTLSESGRIDEALQAVERAIEFDPAYEEAHSARLFMLHYSERHDARAIDEAHRQWATARARPLAPARGLHPNDRTAKRRLRIGYVSPDFRQHSVAFFMTPILERHDAKGFEIICYADVRSPDAMTRRMRSLAHGWRDIAALDDERVAGLIAEDRVDILVDLALHSGTNRALVFARKPAPVQAAYLGYAGSTGLDTVDYKITDALLDPPGAAERWHTEKLLRLAGGSFCYAPPAASPPVAPPPALARGEVAFAAFQNLAKVSAASIALWAGVLSAVPGSRLALKARGLGSEPIRERLRASFAAHGVDPARLAIDDWSDLDRYLAGFREVDIALDTTPFCGGTTTCHSLWMGVPVVTLTGERSVGRVGASMLGSAGLPELVARTPDAYVNCAVSLARDLPRLAALRAGLRARLQQSRLTDARAFTAELESAYRRIWRDWCVGIPSANVKN